MWVFVGVFVLLLGSAQSEAGTGNHSQKRNHHPNAQRLAVIDRYVAIGDSYTSGAGIPPVAPSGCFRSLRNYPRRVAERLRLSADIAFEDVSCGAANTSNAEYPQTTFAYNPPQLSEVTARTDLVTVSLGINDAGFASLFTQCPAVAVYDPTGAPCQRSFQTVMGDLLFAGVYAVTDRLTRVLELVKSRAPHAQIMLIGYPQPVPDSGTCAELPFAVGDYAYARQFFVALDSSMRLAARQAGVTYIDVLTASHGHDVCAGENAWVQGAGTSTRSTAYHPFANEQRAVAGMVVDALKGPLT
jgi:lysophospholipase L1-like esterase